MKKRLISFLLVLVLVISVCPMAMAMGDTTNVGELTLVSGDPDLKDEDALVLLIMGDGFTAAEQDDFYARAKETADYIMSCKPYNEFADTIKIYALGVESKESGVTGANASSAAEVVNDRVDTYFESSFWSFGMDRLVSLTATGEQRGYALRDTYLPETDYCLYIVNSTVYGGSGGDYCVASLNTRSYDMMVHEMGHTIGGLADEYYAAGYEGEYANLTADPDHVPWERFIGKNGIGVYDWGGNPDTGYYIPSLDCKMQYLSTGTTTYDLCDVCQEQMRKAICSDSNVTKLFFQTYADEFVMGNLPDMREYFILRRGDEELTGDKLGDALTLTYYAYDYDTDDWVVLENAPTEYGYYYIYAEFAGNDEFDACEAEGTYEIVPLEITLEAVSKVEDGKPAQVTYSVKAYDETYIEKLQNEELYISVDHFGAASNYGTYVTYDCYDNGDGTYYTYYTVYEWNTATRIWDTAVGETYEAAPAPTRAADYTVSLTVYDYDYDAEDWVRIAGKDAYYSITTQCNTLLNNDSSYYYGATPYANNQNIIIYGEGFTLEEQNKFDALAQQLMESILATEPFKETQLYFDIVSVNTVSQESGIGSSAEGANDTFFRMTYDAETGKLIPSYDATYSASYLAYSFAGYQGATIVIVNDENATGCDTYYSESMDLNGYHMFSTVYVTPNDENWTAYAAQEVLNHLTWEAAGYVPATEEAKEQQRMDLIYVMYYEDTEYNACAPIIVSRAYDEKFVFNGMPVDLYPYFHVYRGYEELPNVNLQLYYYDANGNLLDGAPSLPGSYSVWAVTVPYDPDPSNPDESYWEYYMPEGYTDYDDALWLGMARGYTTFTIVADESAPSNGGLVGGLGSASSGKTETPSTGFVDVPASAFYFDAVQWAVENGVTSGTSARTFSPDKPCTRAEAVTFLWRAMGEPEPETSVNPFTDVSSSDYYYKAVLWAVEQGITTGTGDTTFSPSAPCSRAQIVTFLWRLDGSEDVDAANPFQDVADGAYYAGPVLWAVEEGVTTGASATAFSPDASCTRAQIVTFLYRYIAG